MSLIDRLAIAILCGMGLLMMKLDEIVNELRNTRVVLDQIENHLAIVAIERRHLKS